MKPIHRQVHWGISLWILVTLPAVVAAEIHMFRTAMRIEGAGLEVAEIDVSGWHHERNAIDLDDLFFPPWFHDAEGTFTRSLPRGATSHEYEGGRGTGVIRVTLVGNSGDGSPVTGSFHLLCDFDIDSFGEDRIEIDGLGNLGNSVDPDSFQGDNYFDADIFDTFAAGNLTNDLNPGLEDVLMAVGWEIELQDGATLVLEILLSPTGQTVSGSSFWMRTESGSSPESVTLSGKLSSYSPTRLDLRQTAGLCNRTDVAVDLTSPTEVFGISLGVAHDAGIIEVDEFLATNVWGGSAPEFLAVNALAQGHPSLCNSTRGISISMVGSLEDPSTNPAPAGETTVGHIRYRLLAAADGIVNTHVKIVDCLVPASISPPTSVVTSTPNGGVSPSPATGEWLALQDTCVFSRGNCNGNDSNVDLNDAIVSLRYVILGQPIVDCEKECDVDDNGSLDVGDGILLLQYLFLGGVQPASPFPMCGEDPTPDALTCESHSCADRSFEALLP